MRRRVELHEQEDDPHPNYRLTSDPVPVADVSGLGSAAVTDTADFAQVDHAHTAAEIAVDSTGWTGPLAGVTNVQEAFAALDAFFAEP